MKHEFSNETPMLRLAFAVAALSVTLSIGGFIDFLAVGYAVVADARTSSTDRRSLFEVPSMPGMSRIKRSPP